MSNVNMVGMNAAMAGGPVGGVNPMMNNGQTGGIRPPMNANQKAQLNTYIYEYFLTNGMYECARTLLNSDQGMIIKDTKDSPGRRRDDNGNIMGNGTDSMDGDSKDDVDSKRPDDLPNPGVPKDAPESCFLYEWWCLFWDMFNAQRDRNVGDMRNATQYLTHTQAQSRMRQEHQQAMLRNMRPDMMPTQYQQMMIRNQQQQNGMNMKQNDIARTAMQNNRNATPQQMAILQQQQAKQQQMQRDPSDISHPRPQSPASGENAPSPSKRPRLDGAPFNSQQGMMPNGRGQGVPAQQVGNSGPSNSVQQAAQLQLANGFDPNSLTAQQFQAFQNQNPGATQQKSMAAYQASLSQHTQAQISSKGMPNPGGPPNQGSPMMSQGQDGGAIAGYYNAGEMGANGVRGGVPGGAQQNGGNHALQDYQMQLMLLEQQNKKRLMMARQEQDSMAGPRDGMPGAGPGGPPGPGGPGPNGQGFQGTSPQGARPGASPNSSEQMKRGTPHMNNAGIPSPLPEGQSRGSPSAMNFMPGNQMDPNMAPQFNGMNGMNMMPNGMRPPSSHPGQPFNGQMTPQQQQMAMARQAQQQQQTANGWQPGPNGQMMPQGGQGPPQQMGTPQQRAMPPPSAPAAGAAGNGRTQPSSPQPGAAPPTPSQANKANPKGKKDSSKDTKAKKGGKKGQAPTPAADSAQEPATPTPATPITPQHNKSFNGQNGAVQPMPNGQQPAPMTAPAQPTDLGGLNFDSGAGMDFQGFEFANPSGGNMDVLQDFDFDSFLHQDGGEVDGFSFDTNAFLDGGEIGAE
ncbi:hypothetical protein BP6252_03068 [Coleophoma cylindrospora]|uniref:Uncharacterized protein n=1 Tax=Coleophoma cylindrospora TaxID=1849047 RepID=A0A3D8S6R4_9HELO|nr:hypothetical protein BP6252_03068 [Coleophoma cylindrospora]